jgi:hypothetical protein
MGEPVEPDPGGPWRVAGWALRVGYAGLVIAVAGLITLSLGSTRWDLAVGVIIWLAAATIMATGFLWSRHELPEPRPGSWSMRVRLLHDTVHGPTSTWPS